MKSETETTEENDEKIEKRRRKKAARFAVPVIVLLSVPSILVYGPSLIRFKLIREPLFAALNANIPGTVSVSAVKLSLARGELELRDLKLITAEGVTVISADSLALTLVPGELFDRKIHVSKLELFRPNLNLGSDSAGRFNIVSIFADSLKPADPNRPKGSYPPKLPFTVTVDSLKIDSLTGRYFMGKPQLAVNIGSLSLGGRVSLFPIKAKLQISGSDIIYRDRTRNIVTSRIDLYAEGSDSSADTVNLRLVTPNETLAVRGSASGWFDDSIEVHADAEGSFSLAMIKEISGADIGDGVFTVHCRADGGIGNPTVSGVLGYRGNSLCGTGINQIDLPVSLENRIVSTPNGRVTRSDGTVVKNVNLTVGLQGYFPRGFTKKMGDLNTLWYRGKASGYAPKIPETDLPLAENRLELSINGHGIMPDYLDFTSDFVYKTVGTQNGTSAPLTLSGKVSMKDQIIGLAGISLVVSDARFGETDGSVNLKAKSMDLSVDLEKTDLSRVKPFVKGGFPVSGVIGGTVSLKGRYSSPEIQFDLEGSEMEVYRYPLGAVTAKGAVSPVLGTALVQGNASGGSGNVQYDLTGTLFKPGSFAVKKVPFMQLHGTADSLNLAVWSNGAVDGRASGVFDYSGWIGKGSGTVSASVDSLRNKQFVIPKIIAETALDDSLVTVRSCEISLYDSVRVKTSGTYHLNGLYNFTAAVDTIEPRRFIPAVPADPKILLVGTASAKGSIKNPSAEVTFTVPNLVWNDIAIGTQDVRAVLADNRVTFTGEGIADLNGYYDLKTAQYGLNSSVRQFFLDPYFAAYGQKSLMGSLDADLFARGTSKGLDTAILTIPRLSVKSGSSDFIDGENALLTYGKQGLSIDSLTVKLMNRGHASVSGTQARDQSMNIIVDMDFPLAIAERFTSEVERVEGDVKFRGKITGTPKLPKIEAEASVDSVSMTLTGTQQRLRGVCGSMRFFEDSLKVDRFRAALDDGAVSAEGSVLFHKNRPVSSDFSAKLYNLPVSLPETADLRLGGDIRYTADSVSQKVDGTVDLLECYYYQNINPLPKLDAVPKKKPMSSQTTASMMDKTALSIRIIPRKNIFVDNNLAVFDIRPELQITGTASNPILEGRMDILSGELSYLNRRFSVNRGRIDFINPEKLEAEVEITAETTIDQWKITLKVEGVVGKELKYSSTSVPPLQDNELAALLLTGKPSILEGPEFNSADFLMKQLSSAAKDKLGFDVEVDLKNSSVKIADQVNRRIFTDYQVIQEDAEMKQIAAVLVKLFDQLNIRGFAGSEGTAGGEVQVHGQIR